MNNLRMKLIIFIQVVDCQNVATLIRSLIYYFIAACFDTFGNDLLPFVLWKLDLLFIISFLWVHAISQKCGTVTVQHQLLGIAIQNICGVMFNRNTIAVND